jgi:uncharacterized protein (DUF2141 family)
MSTIACLALAFSLPVAAAEPPALTIELLGFRNDAGQVLVDVYAGPEGFPQKPEKAVRRLTAKIENHAAKVIVDPLPAGTYAVAAVHDENGDGQMQTKIFGIPKEGVGASNDAKGFMGPPKFKDARFEHGTAPQVITIHMKYL